MLVEPQPLLSDSPLVPGLRRPQDVEVARQRDRRPRRPRHDPREGPLLHHRPAEGSARRPGRPEICPIFALHPRFSPDIVEWTRDHCRTGELGCVDCKTNLADRIEELRPFRERRAELATEPGLVGKVLAEGESGYGPSSQETLAAVRDAMGFSMSAERRAPSAARSRSSCRCSPGPFRLLADLILEQKVDVCDVRIATVTDAFLAYAKDAERWNLEEATWFLAMCAVLLELKVGRLMPRHTDADEEDLLGGSPDLAYARSLELAAFRQVAVELARRLEDEAGFFTRDVGPGPEFAHLYPDPMTKVEPRSSRALAAQLLRPPPTLDLSHVTPIRYTMAEAISAVERIEDFGRAASFRDLVADCDERIQVVVRFLALLELYRDGKVELAQGDTFGEIRVEWQG